MMDLTPRWQQIRQSHADAHAALQWVAVAIYEQSEETVPAPPINEVDFGPALKLGFITSDDGKIGFSNPDVRHDYLVRHAVELTLEAWDEPEKFASLFNYIYGCSIRINVSSQIAVSVLLVLNYEYKKDIVGRVAEVARLDNAREKRDRSFWSLYDPFCDVLPELNFEFESLVDALSPILQTSAGYKIYSIVEHLAARSQNNADFLYNEFLARQESPVVALALNALLGLAKLDLQEAHRRALVLTDSDLATLRQIGIATLGDFKYETGGQYDLLRVTLDKFNDLKTTFNVETDLVLVRAYGNLVSKSEEAVEVIVEFASHQDLAVQNEVSRILYQKANDAYNCPWYKEALLHLVQVVSFPAEMLQTLDVCIKYYAHNDPNTALEVIENIALGWNYSRGREEATLPKILDGTFIELHNNHLNILNAKITSWLSSDDTWLHFAAYSVLNFFNSIPVNEKNEETKEVVLKKTTKKREITLSKKVLESLDEQAVIFLLCRLAGNTTYIRSLAALLLSAMKREPYSPVITGSVINLLSDYVLYNHPRDAGDYLKSRMEDEGATEVELNVIREALNRSDAYFDERQKLPRLKELEPSSQRTYLLRLAKWKQQTAMMEQAERLSVFASILPKVRLKYGRAVSYERDGDFTEPSKLASFSYECELPQGEFIDPLGQAYQRRIWQNAGLSNQKNRTEDEITGETDK